MIKQGFDFFINDYIDLKKLEDGFKISFEHDYAKIYYASKIEKVEFFINSINFTDPEKLKVFQEDPIDLKYKLSKNKCEIIIENLSFEIEETDHLKVIFHFDVDEREGNIDLLLSTD